MIDIICTLIFCFLIYQLGSLQVINGKFVFVGVLIWIVGWFEGRREKK